MSLFGSSTTGSQTPSSLQWSSPSNILTFGGNPIPSSAVADLLAQNAAVASIVASTSQNDGLAHTYSVGGYISITAVTLANVTLQVDFTDQNNTPQTLSFFGEGLTTAALSTTGFVGFSPLTIRCYPNTAITIKTIATITTSIAYDVGGFITRIS